jgi:hypothetical protein
MNRTEAALRINKYENIPCPSIDDRIDLWVDLGMLRLDGEETTWHTNPSTHVLAQPVREARDELHDLMARINYQSKPEVIFDWLNDLLRKMDVAAGVVTAGHPERPTTEDFDALPAEEQKVVVDNMSLPAGYQQPTEWFEGLCRAHDSRDQVALEDAACDLIGNVELGRWQIVSRVPERYDAKVKQLAEIEEALRALSVKNPARDLLRAKLADMVSKED